jgi:hypothetical protein
MDLPTYVNADEVKRVCQILSIRDWSALPDGQVTPEEAKLILAEVNTAGAPIDLESFRQGLEVELEHGTRFPDANVTNNHPILTGKIVIAHLKETLDYYQRLDVAEIEGDLLKAAKAGNGAKLETLYKKLVRAKLILAQMEAKALEER